jgi:DNA modification methylase
VSNLDSTKIFDKFDVQVDDQWSFSESRSIHTWTHGYHRYPAKFIPQLVKKLIEEFAQPGYLIADPFAGCGTTLVECKVHGYESIGVDINPVAELITKAKITPIEPQILKNHITTILPVLSEKQSLDVDVLPVNNRIDYWFSTETKQQVSNIYSQILEISNIEVKNFFLTALSNILKTSSRWLQDSTKPQIDKKKKVSDPLQLFISQIKMMEKRNSEFYRYLAEKGHLKLKCEIKKADARDTGLKDDSIDLIITSPPYVTSYEYADIHQLTGYWFQYFDDIKPFRKKFIGTFYSNNEELNVESEIGRAVIKHLYDKDKRIAREVANYFNDMQLVIKEMRRILKPGSQTCIVIGNNKLRGIDIETARILGEYFEMEGFEINTILKRNITAKQIPTIRDEISGRFVKMNHPNSTKVYPNEYIIIARKSDADN